MSQDAIEVYVRPFPGPGGKWLISTGGGAFPTWSRTKHELFYVDPNGQIMVAPYKVERNAFIAEKPRLWSERRVLARGPTTRMFDLHRDGDRVAFAPAAQTSRHQAGPSDVHLQLLRRAAPHCAGNTALSLQPGPSPTPVTSRET